MIAVIATIAPRASQSPVTDATVASTGSQLWEQVSTVGRWALTRCAHPPTPAFPTGDYHMAVVCPPEAPLEADEILNAAGVAVFDPGVNVAGRAERYRVYIADPGEGRVIAFGLDGAATVISDARSFRQQYQFTPPSTGRGPASSPGFGEVPDGIAYGASGVAVDAAGNLLVAELDAARVEVFGPDGTFRFNRKIGPPDRVRELRPGALGVAVSPGTTVAAPATDCSTLGAGRIAVSTQFNAMYTSASDSHILPQGLKFDDMAQMHQVLVFDERFCAVGALGQASQWGSDAPGSFRNPEGLAFDADGRLIVADAANGRVQIFAPDAYNDPLAPKTPVLILDDFDLPVALVLDADGRLIVPDKSRQRLTVYELAYPPAAPATATAVYSIPLSRIGEADANLAQFPTGIAIDAEGRLHIAEGPSVVAIAPPSLAVYDVVASASAVQTGGRIEISYSIAVPPGKAPVAGIVPRITAAGATLVSGPTPVAPNTETAPVDLSAQQAVRYRSTFAITAAAPELVTFAVSAGNGTISSPSRTVAVRIVPSDGETTAPGVSARISGNQQGGVYVGPVIVTLTATDASGVSQIGWRWASGPHTASDPGDSWNTYEPAAMVAEHEVSVERTGTTELRYWAVDAQGIRSAEHSLTLVLDVDGPSLFPTYTPDSAVRQPQGGPWWTSDVLIGVNVSDTTTTDAAIDVSPKEAVLATAEGQVVAFTAVDQFGHQSTFSVTARIDRFAPTVAALPAAGSYSRGVTVTAQGADTASGIASLEYSLAGTQTVSRTAYASAIVLNQSGSTRLTIYARDWAGRTTQASFDYRIGR